MPTNPTITPSVSVIVPAMNEARNLPHVLPMIPTWVHEVILVDGNSTDDTVEVAQRLIPSVRIIPQHGKGKGAALRTGFAAARGDIIVMLDADGSTDPREIPAFVGQLVKGADFVKGSRFMQGGGTDDMPLYRKLGNASLRGRGAAALRRPLHGPLLRLQRLLVLGRARARSRLLTASRSRR